MPSWRVASALCACKLSWDGERRREMKAGGRSGRGAERKAEGGRGGEGRRGKEGEGRRGKEKGKRESGREEDSGKTEASAD